MSFFTEKILVTGANGFVGSRLCRKLLADGYPVVAGIREGCDVSLIDDIDIEMRFGDVTAIESLPEYIRDVEIIIHNAGLVKASTPDDLFRVNADGTENLIKSAVKQGQAKRFILISSMAASGPSLPGKPRTEEMDASPVTDYGRSKLAAERIAREYADKISLVILRPSGIYGPGDQEVFTFFETLNNRIKPYLGGFSRRLQLLHVNDLIRAVVVSMTAEIESGSAYFIAEPRSYSYYQLVKLLRRAVGRMALPVYIPGWLLRLIAGLSETIMRKKNKTPMLTVEKCNELLADWEVSTEKAARELNFTADIDFETGARQTVYWYREEGWL